ncbi:MAG: type II toxin-antitoxin system death-on-curing family toxin [Parcubacteria group bacterium]
MEDIQYVAHSLAKELMSWDEPIPAFETRFPNKLEACVALPFQTWDKRLLYQGLMPKAAVLFYSIIKNHPFQNGNKRIAVTSMLTFLYKNKRWLSADNQRLYNLAKWVAESDPLFKDETVHAIEKFLKIHLTHPGKTH